MYLVFGVSRTHSSHNHVRRPLFSSAPVRHGNSSLSLPLSLSVDIQTNEWMNLEREKNEITRTTHKMYGEIARANLLFPILKVLANNCAHAACTNAPNSDFVFILAWNQLMTAEIQVMAVCHARTIKCEPFNALLAVAWKVRRSYRK